jgi:lactate dehydrogenase-like 2-hydroxyacid dehydrogenase
MGLGMDKFDLGTAPAARVTVSIAVGANAVAVSEHVLMLMLATYRRLALAGRKLREGTGCARSFARRAASFPARRSTCSV